MHIKLKSASQLGLGQRARLVVTGDDRCGRGQRIGGAEGDVCHRDRDVVDDVAVHHVAKVEDPRDGLARLVDEDVVVVGVAMDDAAPEVREHRDDMGPMVRCKCCDPVGERSVGDQGEIRADDALGVREVPMEITMEGRMIEVRERATQATDRATEVPPQGVRVETRRSECRARQHRDESHELETVHADRGALDGTDQSWGESARLQMEHDRTFGLEHLTPFGRIGQFEDEALP